MREAGRAREKRLSSLRLLECSHNFPSGYLPAVPILSGQTRILTFKTSKNRIVLGNFLKFQPVHIALLEVMFKT